MTASHFQKTGYGEKKTGFLSGLARMVISVRLYGNVFVRASARSRQLTQNVSGVFEIDGIAR